MRAYGHDAGNDTLYFTGTHKIGVRNRTTSMTMRLDGFDVASGRITNPSGGIVLTAENGADAAVWSFSRLLLHWGRKHAQAAYVKYANQEELGAPTYLYLNPIWLGEGTDFSVFLQVMSEGIIVYDPGSKVKNASAPQPSVKARSQFRIRFNKTNRLYKTFAEHHI